MLLLFRVSMVSWMNHGYLLPLKNYILAVLLRYIKLRKPPVVRSELTGFKRL